jgi:hypothetical protein
MAYSAVMAAMGLGLAEAGWTRWFPWSMPMAATGMVLFPAVPMPGLVPESWALMALLFLAGVAAALRYVDRADNTQ